MRKAICLIYAAALTIVACRKQEASAPPKPKIAVTNTIAAPPVDLEGKKIDMKIPIEQIVASDCKTGTALDPSGVVAKEETTFTKKQPVFLSMGLKEAPTGLVVTLRVTDKEGKEVTFDRKPASGAKSIAFKTGPFKTGDYRLLALWGANEACTKHIDVK